MIATHPGDIQHNGMPYGQPIGPGHAPSPGQHMGQPLQMHPGAAGPNGPHVNQAGPMMAGMQAGASPAAGGPNAHALSHLSTQAQMYQQHPGVQQASKYQTFIPLLRLQVQIYCDFLVIHDMPRINNHVIFVLAYYCYTAFESGIRLLLGDYVQRSKLGFESISVFSGFHLLAKVAYVISMRK